MQAAFDGAAAPSAVVHEGEGSAVDVLHEALDGSSALRVWLDVSHGISELDVLHECGRADTEAAAAPRMKKTVFKCMIVDCDELAMYKAIVVQTMFIYKKELTSES